MTLPDTAETLAKLRILRTQGIGPVTYRKLMQRHENAVDICADWERLRTKTGQPFPALAKADSVLRELEALHKAGGVLLMQGDADFPPQLAELPDTPIVLSVLGDPSSLAKRQVAIVGNRSASASGLTWSKQLANDIARHGIVATSGLARGIDTAVHEGAIAAGGYTVAVVAGGVDNIYPPENAKLREAILAHGCVVSEQPWGMQPTASLFPRRNRVIAGLSIGVVVSEATRHSGSLITAEFALNYGRDVWAVPGSPTDPRSAGPNWLLKNGATLIEGAEDVLRDLPQRPAPFVLRARDVAAQTSLFDSVVENALVESVDTVDGNTTPTQRVYGLLGSVAAGFDDLVRQSGLDEPTLSGLLVEMELDGHAVRESDGRWKRS
ncbi:MAG: DNA-protecting protein DprA [Alphaproteobacteria bacterium]|nr:MAG: DNA-protecting protein DprA [Alphaproteobacteria bacterium]